MLQAKREPRERTDHYHLLQQWCRTSEQRLYEGIRPVGLCPLQETTIAAPAMQFSLEEAFLASSSIARKTITPFAMREKRPARPRRKTREAGGNDQ